MPELALTYEFHLLEDMHTGTGAGRLGMIDDMQSRDQKDKPVVWASTVRGLLREAAEDWLHCLGLAGAEEIEKKLMIPSSREFFKNLAGRKPFADYQNFFMLYKLIGIFVILKMHHQWRRPHNWENWEVRIIKAAATID